MSTKTSIFLTKDDEHWYSDCGEPLNKKDDAITLEFSKKNVRIDINDEDDIVLTITNPDCEIYKRIKNIGTIPNY